MNNKNYKNRKMQDGILRGLIYLAAAVTVSILLIIVGFIVYKGAPGINFAFLTRSWDDKTTFVNVALQADKADTGKEGYIPSLGITVKEGEKNLVIVNIDKNSPVKDALNLKNSPYPGNLRTNWYRCCYLSE